MKFDANDIAKALAAEGKLLEAGWAVMRGGLPAIISEQQMNDMQILFYMGADHIFYSILGIMDEEREPTEQDLQLMSNIDKELQAFRKRLPVVVRAHL